MDREGRPARSDRPAPQLDRRRRGPVGLDPHAANDAVALRSAKAGPVGCPSRFCRLALRFDASRESPPLREPAENRCESSASGPQDRWRTAPLGGFSGSAAAGAGEGATGSSPAWARSRSSGVCVHRQWKSYLASAGDATGAEERPHSAREQDRRDHRRAPRSVRRGDGWPPPSDQREAQDRDGADGEQHPHHPARDRLVDDAPGREQRDDHQDDGAQALGPGRPAEEQPPHDDKPIRRQLPQAPRTIISSGATTGATNLTSHSRIATTTPGHSRSGFRVGSAVCAIVTSDNTLPQGVLFRFSRQHRKHHTSVTVQRAPPCDHSVRSAIAESTRVARRGLKSRAGPRKRLSRSMETEACEEIYSTEASGRPEMKRLRSAGH